MKILSIDVGIKNLAFCLFEKSNEYEHFNITKWDIINLSESESLTCCFTDKNGVCNKPAKFKKDNNCYCIKHSKKQQYCIPTSEQKPSFVNKQNLQKLSTDLLLPEIDENDLIFVRDKDNGRDIDL